MRFFQITSRLLIILIFLPWGAYAGVPVTPSRVLPFAVSLGDVVKVEIADWDQTRITLTKKCRSATLPGFACSPDHAIPSNTVGHWWVPLCSLAGFALDWAKRGRTDPPPRVPPRFS